jgi:hypothetical protein
MVGSRTALLAALGADNAGSGLFRRWQAAWETGPDPGGS